MNFFYILNNSEHFVIYSHVDREANLIFALNHFLKIRKNIRKLCFIYSLDSEKPIAFEHTDIKLYKSPINFEPALLHHNKLKDRTADKLNNKLEFLKLYDDIVVSLEEIKLDAASKRKEVNINLAHGIQKSKEDYFKEYSNVSIDSFFYLKLFFKFIKKAINTTFNFEKFFSLYTIPCITSAWFGDTVSYSTAVLENVYYKDKNFYEATGNLANIEALKQDIEYCHYNKKNLSNLNDALTIIEEPVLFLDYIYNFYNFGEFWDVLQRLMYFPKKGNIELFGLSAHRVSDIASYFTGCGYNFPPKYISNNKQEQHNAIFFKKVYFSLINNTCRGSLNRWAAYEINNLFNPDNLSASEYKLYLVRGKMARGVYQEKEIIETFEKKYNFKILDGSETLEEQKHYFTNASFIIGAHSSLMKNIVWCKKNPTFIEMCPSSRTHMCFYGNAKELGFPAIILPFLCNEKEEIIITTEQKRSLYDLVELFL
jgi:hypothetical protein